MRISLFVTCFNDTLFPQTGRAVVELLERLGCEVAFPEAVSYTHLTLPTTPYV